MISRRILRRRWLRWFFWLVLAHLVLWLALGTLASFWVARAAPATVLDLVELADTPVDCVEAESEGGARCAAALAELLQ